LNKKNPKSLKKSNENAYGILKLFKKNTRIRE
jgi:hypothetical protein